MRDWERNGAHTDGPARSTAHLLQELEVLWAEGRSLRQEIDAWAARAEPSTMQLGEVAASRSAAASHVRHYKVHDRMDRVRRDTLGFGVS